MLDEIRKNWSRKKGWIEEKDWFEETERLEKTKKVEKRERESWQLRDENWERGCEEEEEG